MLDSDRGILGLLMEKRQTGAKLSIPRNFTFSRAPYRLRSKTFSYVAITARRLYPYTTIYSQTLVHTAALSGAT